MTGFTTADIPDLAGRTAIITGASSGIGLETAKALAAHGAPAPCSRSKTAADPETTRRLWEASEQLTATRFPEIQQQ